MIPPVEVKIHIEPKGLLEFRELGYKLKKIATSPESTILKDLNKTVSDWLDKGVEYCRKILTEETKIMDRDPYRPAKSKLLDAIQKTGPRIVKGAIEGGFINLKKLEKCVANKRGLNYAYMLEVGYGPYKMSPLQRKWAAFWAKAKGFPPGETPGVHRGMVPVRYIARTATYLRHYYFYTRKIENVVLRSMGFRTTLR